MSTTPSFTIREVQKLNEKINVLSRFISKIKEKIHAFAKHI